MPDSLTRRLRQESTWRGIVCLVAMVGSLLRPEHATMILSVALGLCGAINAAKKD